MKKGFAAAGCRSGPPPPPQTRTLTPSRLASRQRCSPASRRRPRRSHWFALLCSRGGRGGGVAGEAEEVWQVPVKWLLSSSVRQAARQMTSPRIKSSHRLESKRWMIGSGMQGAPARVHLHVHLSPSILKKNYQHVRVWIHNLFLLPRALMSSGL